MIYLLLTQWRVFNLIIRAFSSSVSNAKYLAFSTPNTKNKPSWGVSNAKNFGTLLQYRLKYETVWTKMAKFYIIIILFTFSLSSSQISLSLSVFSSLSSLSSLFLFHSMPITKGHHSMPVLSTCNSPPPLTSRSPLPLAKDRLLYSLELASSTCQVARISFDTNVARLRQRHLLLAK